MGLALGMALKCYTSATKVLKLKVRKFQGLVLTFVEVTGEKLVGGIFSAPNPEYGYSLYFCSTKCWTKIIDYIFSKHSHKKRGHSHSQHSHSQDFSIALFDQLFVASGLALGEHLLSTIYDLSKLIFDKQ